MIVCHKYKFIFIKTGKTAGTSIEIALSKFCGSEDIITPFEPEDEEIRRSLSYRGPQNYVIPKSRYSIRDWIRFLRLKLKGNKMLHQFRRHDSAEKIKKYIGDEIWNSYFKFCVERNPWDRIISRYYWDNQTEPRPSVSEFLESAWALRLQCEGIDLYTINGKIVVDKMCFYENLENDLEDVRLRLGLPEKLFMPNAKGSHRKDRRSYREVLNLEQAEKIRELCSKEIALFGYKF